ncbi:hypothetical protein WKR98_23185 [Pigmentiphaga sp. YJ18]|uniref:hypothetical protein n=1 Tax=Pigmentiphaga sp. YJ18 TaxID=3134907 RepID=UPI00310D0497
MKHRERTYARAGLRLPRFVPPSAGEVRQQTRRPHAPIVVGIDPAHPASDRTFYYDGSGRIWIGPGDV